LNDGSTYYGQVQQILPLQFKPDTTHSFPAGFRKHTLNKNFSSGSGVEYDKDGSTTNLIKEETNKNEPLFVEDLTLVSDEYKDKIQTIRHGFGIQIYANGQGRYAGEWLFNKKTGEGHMVYTDGSEYRGGLVNGVKHGYGCYIWPKQSSDSSHGHIYIGNWKNGMMQGEGKF
jgi:hypothetical protein